MHPIAPSDLSPVPSHTSTEHTVRLHLLTWHKGPILTPSERVTVDALAVRGWAAVDIALAVVDRRRGDFTS